MHLFVRREGKIEGRAAPFTYCGELDFVSGEGEKPIIVRWKLRHELPDPVAKRFLP
jgi:hypothetical protein